MNKKDSRKYKTFKEDNQNSEKISKMIKQIKKMEKFENFSDYKKKQRENDKGSNLNSNKYFEDDNDEAYKDYFGDDDDDENENEKEKNSEEFLEKAYHNYVSDMMKKEKKKNFKDDFDVSEDEEEHDNINNYNEAGNRNLNRFEERKDVSSQEESEEGRLITD